MHNIYVAGLMRFLLANLKDGTFLTQTGQHTCNRPEAITFDTEDKALSHSRKYGLLASHVPVSVLAEQLIPKRRIGSSISP